MILQPMNGWNRLQQTGLRPISFVQAALGCRPSASLAGSSKGTDNPDES
jgi:hypothetical protein